MGQKIKKSGLKVYAAAVAFVYGENPKRSGTYLAASLTNVHRVFQAHYRVNIGWALKDRGRNIYAWAELPEFPPVPDNVGAMPGKSK